MGAGASSTLDGLSTEQHDLVEARYSTLKSAGLKVPQIFAQIGREMESMKVTTEPPPQLTAIERARKRVAMLTKSISLKATTNYLVAVDGSGSSNTAVEVCLQELMKSRDCITALHVFDSTKVNVSLPAAMKPEALHEAVDVQLMTRMRKERYALNWVDKKGQETRPFLLKVVNSIADNPDDLPVNMQPSYFVTGTTGRKANKKIGSLPILAAGQFHLPNIIIKQGPAPFGRPRVFVAAIKDLEHTAPYYLALDLMRPGKGDKLVVLHDHLEDNGLTQLALTGTGFDMTSTETMLKRYGDHFNARFSDDGVDNNAVFRAIARTARTSIKDAILVALEAEKADYLILYPAMESAGLTLMQSMIEEVQCNVIICKR